MLHLFLSANRAQIIDLCKAKAAKRPTPQTSRTHQEFGIPLFLDQVIATLKAEATSKPALSLKISGAAGGAGGDKCEIGKGATKHGRELSDQGFTFQEVVHDYGDLCQVITGLAVETGTPIDVEEFKSLNRCLDTATADAVSEFGHQHDDSVDDKAGKLADERLYTRTQQMRKHIQTAMMAVAAIKAGNVGLSGVTGKILDYSLEHMQTLNDQPLGDPKAKAAALHRIK
jgi:hypothetical protein